MIKKLILSTLRKLIVFLNVRLKIKKHPPSPPDYYFSEVSKNSYDYFKKYFDKAYVFSDDNSIRRFSISKAAKNFDNSNLFLEFGVFKGDSINLFANVLKEKNIKIYGFDSFKGLKDEWMTEEYNPVGTFNVKGKKPKTEKNVELIDGWVEDTVKKFITNTNKKIAFVHFDMDTYNSTSYVLKLIKNNFQSGTVILFDEFYGFPNWEKYEFKALKEQLNENSFQYIAFGTRQACIQII